MKRKLNILAGDVALWIVFIVLTGISLIAVYTTIGFSAIAESGSTPAAQFFKHLGFVFFTWGVVVFMSHVNYRRFAKFASPMLWVGGAFLVLALVLGTRWIKVPYLPISFQPSEFAKIFLLVFLARAFARNEGKLDDRNTFVVSIVLPVVAVCLLIVPENLSTAILLFSTCFFLLFFAGYNTRRWWKWFVILLVIGFVFFLFIYYLGDKIDAFRSSTWGHRLQNWINPDPDELSQENMARMAIARGGFLGPGIGETIHGRLTTQAHNDFIFAFIIEEVGSVIASIIFFLYIIFYYRCIHIATDCKGHFGSLCVAGLGTVIFLQALINMSVAVGLLPVTGQTLPFISYGGSSYIALGLALGVIQSVAADNRRQARLAKAAETQAQNPDAEAVTNTQPVGSDSADDDSIRPETINAQ